MKSFRLMFPVLGILATLAGCSAGGGASGGVESADTTQAASTTVQTDHVARGDHRMHARPHGGPDALVFAALHENINLTPAQKTTLEGLVAANKHQRPEFDKTRATKLADQIRAGKIDTAAPGANADGREAAMKAHLAASAKTLATLHDTLTPEQRVALIDAVTARQAKMAERFAGKGKEERRGHRGAQGEARGEQKPGQERRGHGRQGEIGQRGPMGGFLQGLELTQEQKDAIKTKLDADRPARATEVNAQDREAKREAMKTKFEAMKKEMDAKLQSFKSDSFDANAFVTPPVRDGANNGKMGAWGPKGERGHGPKNLAVIVSVLTPAQREKLAQRIEQGPPARPESAGKVVR